MYNLSKELRSKSSSGNFVWPTYITRLQEALLSSAVVARQQPTFPHTSREKRPTKHRYPRFRLYKRGNCFLSGFKRDSLLRFYLAAPSTITLRRFYTVDLYTSVYLQAVVPRCYNFICNRSSRCPPLSKRFLTLSNWKRLTETDCLLSLHDHMITMLKHPQTSTQQPIRSWLLR